MSSAKKVTSLIEYRNCDVITLAKHILEHASSGEIKGLTVAFDLGEWGQGTSVAGTYSNDPERGFLELLLALNKVKKIKGEP